MCVLASISLISVCKSENAEKMCQKIGDNNKFLSCIQGVCVRDKVCVYLGDKIDLMRSNFMASTQPGPALGPVFYHLFLNIS